MKITKSQLKQIIKEELKKVLAEASTITDPSGEPSRRVYSSDEYQQKLSGKSQRRAAALKRLEDEDPDEYEKLIAKTDQDREAAESDPDRAYIDMIKGIMRDMGMRVSAVPGDERQNRLLDQAIEELEMEQKRPAGGGLGGPGGKARHPTRKEIEDAHRHRGG